MAAADAEFPFQYVGFSFEKDFNVRSWHEFFKAHWTYSIYMGLVYLVVVFGLVRFIKDRPALNLNGPLALWCLSVAVINGSSAYRLWQDYFMYRNLRLAGSTVCQDYSCNTEVHGLAMVVFCLVKPWRSTSMVKPLILADTLFLALRKQKIPFVQVYHHFTTLIFVWYCAAEWDFVGRYFTISNCTADVVIFGYRFLRATRLIRIPRSIQTSIILAILLNLVVIFVVNYLAYHYQSGGEFAGKNEFIQQGMMFLSSSYFVLFVRQFFFN